MEKFYAITSTGGTVKSLLDLRFGKCQYIVLYSKKDKASKFIQNPFIEEKHSAIALINFLKNEGVTTIITGEIGPMASDKLEKEHIQLALIAEKSIKIGDIFNRING